MATDGRCIIGLTPATTQDGRSHLDGAAALVRGGDVWSLPEERVSRHKHDGGAELALQALLAAAGCSIDDVDAFYLSTCGERIPRTAAACTLSERSGRQLRDLG